MPEEGNSKTVEQLASEKEQRFKENPDNFIELRDIVVATRREPGGLSIFCNPMSLRSELTRSMGEIVHALNTAITQQEMAKYMEKKNEKRIISKPRGMFGRRR